MQHQTTYAQDKIAVLFDEFSIVHHSCQNVMYKVLIDKFDSELFFYRAKFREK